MKLARELAGQEYSGQTIKFTLALKLERFGFLFDLYSSFRPKAEAEPENDASNNEANQQVHRVRESSPSIASILNAFPNFFRVLSQQTMGSGGQFEGSRRIVTESAYGYTRTQSPHRNDDRFHPQSRHSSPLCAFSASNFKLRHYPKTPLPVVPISSRTGVWTGPRARISIISGDAAGAHIPLAEAV